MEPRDHDPNAATITGIQVAIGSRGISERAPNRYEVVFSIAQYAKVKPASKHTVAITDFLKPGLFIAQTSGDCGDDDGKEDE